MNYALLLSVLLSVPSLYAIEYRHTGIKAVLSLPTGSFSENVRFEDDGFAGVGTGPALQAVLTLGSPVLLAVADVMFLYHPLKSDMLKKTEPFDTQNVSALEGGAYLNVPFLFGLGVGASLSNSSLLYSTVQIGFNLYLQRSLRESGTTAFDIDFDTPGPGTAYAFSCGIIFRDRFDISVRYINLGRPELFYEVPSGTESELLSGRRMFYMKTVQILSGIIF